MTWEFILRLLLAAVLGTIIGLDREYRAKSAGFRTHFLVSLGSALFMIISQYGFENVIKQMPDIAKFDPSRVAAQVVTGIGFIGAGTIIIQRQFVKGLTTAAGLWATAGIGMACGAGMYWISISAMILTLVALELLGIIFKNLDMKNISVVFSTNDKDILKKLVMNTNPKDLKIVSFSIEPKESPVKDKESALEDIESTVNEKESAAKEKYLVTMEFKSRIRQDKQRLLNLLEDFPDITFEKIN